MARHRLPTVLHFWPNYVLRIHQASNEHIRKICGARDEEDVLAWYSGLEFRADGRVYATIWITKTLSRYEKLDWIRHEMTHFVVDWGDAVKRDHGR